MKKPFLFAALLALSLPGLARAATLNVPAQYATIQAAVNASANGDTVLIADGTYTGDGNHDIDFGGKNITVTSQHGAASTIINCQGSSSANHRGFSLHSGETNAVISGLTVKNGYEGDGSSSSNAQGGGISDINASLTLQNCLFNADTADFGGGFFSENNSGNSVAVQNCTFTGNAAAVHGAGIYSYTGSKFTATNCLFTGNVAQSYGGGLYDYTSGGGVTAFTNCTFTGNAALQGGVSVYNNSPSNGIVSLDNDILYGDTGAEIAGTTVSAGYDDIQGGYPGTHNIDADPQFVHSPADLHLQPGSPCFGGGTSDGAPATDITGTTRPNPPSIGAYDLAASTSIASPVTHLLWKDTAGDCTVWTIRADNSVTSTAALANPGFTAQSIAEGADGKVRLLWKSSGSASSVWTLAADGTYTATPAYGPYGDYQVQGLAVGADNKTRLLWKSAGGPCTVWTIAADGTVTSTEPFGPYPSAASSTDWQAQQLAVGSDNLPRLLWKDAAGSCTVWTIAANGTITSTVPYGPYGDYQAQALAVGPDNKTRLLWKSAGGASTVWTIAADGTVTSTVPYGPYGDYQAQALAVGPDNTTRLFWKSAGGACTVWSFGLDGTITSTNPYGPYGDYQATALAAGN